MNEKADDLLLNNQEYSELRQASKEIFMDIANESNLSKRIEKNKLEIEKNGKMIKNLDTPKSRLYKGIEAVKSDIGTVISNTEKSSESVQATINDLSVLLKSNDNELYKINTSITSVREDTQKSNEQLYNDARREFSALNEETTKLFQAINLLEEEVKRIYSSNNRSLTQEMSQTNKELTEAKKSINEKVDNLTELNEKQISSFSTKHDFWVGNIEENYKEIKKSSSITNEKVQEAISLINDDINESKNSARKVDEKFDELKQEVNNIKQHSNEQFKSSNLVTRILLGLNFLILVIILIFQFI